MPNSAVVWPFLELVGDGVRDLVREAMGVFQVFKTLLVKDHAT